MTDRFFERAERYCCIPSCAKLTRASRHWSPPNA